MKAAIPNLGREYTLELWIWNGLPTGLRSKTGIIATIGGLEIGIGGIGTEKGKLYLRSESIEARAGTIEVPVKQWQLVTLACSSSQVRVYLNGELQITLHLESRPASDIVLGGGSDGRHSFEGRIDEAAVYPRVLSPSAIRDRWKTSALN